MAKAILELEMPEITNDKAKQLTEAIQQIINSMNRMDELLANLGICAHYDCLLKSVSVYSGIKKLADLYGCELKEGKRECDIYPIKYSFEVDGIRFYSIANERDEQRVLYGDSDG
jgi:hypothetical protein